jgi:periplasmic protein TonB
MMFELTAGHLDRPFRDVHAAPTMFSIVAHSVVIGGLIGVFMFRVSDTLPQVPTIVAFVAEVPAPVPPPAPPPPSVNRAPKSQAQPQAPAPNRLTLIAPAEAPMGIRAESGLIAEDEGGVMGGVEGGMPGGAVGGIPGGLVTDVPLPPPPSAPKPVRIGGAIQAPALIRRVEPMYPPVAVGAKITGLVIVEASVNEQGEVVDVNVLRSIPLLDRAATDAIKQWRYQPLLMNGVATPFMLTVTLTFSIK